MQSLAKALSSSLAPPKLSIGLTAFAIYTNFISIQSFYPTTANSSTLISYYYPLSEIGTAHTILMETTAIIPGDSTRMTSEKD